MADITCSPWLIEPADVGEELRDSSHIVLLRSLVWSGFTDSAHRLRLTDAYDRDIVDLAAGSSLDPVQLTLEGGYSKGLRVAQLDSGRVQLFVR